MSLSRKANQLSQDQSGMASIVVTMIIMIMLSFIVLSAARLASREQRQTFDRQLNTQAFYAAESGVNDAVETINAALTSGSSLLDSDYTTNCDDFTNAVGPSLSPDLGGNVKYTCLLVDPTPTTWEGNIGDVSRTIPIEDKNGAAIASIEIAWQDKDGADNFSGCPTSTNDLPVATAWGCSQPMIRFDLVPTTAVDRAALNDNVMTGFLFPRSLGGSVPTIGYTPVGDTAAKYLTSCNQSWTPKFCKVAFTGLGETSYYLRIKALYGTASVTIAGINPSGDKIELVGAQVVVDSTGKAADILRRIQVRVPLIGAADVPEFTIQSGDTICKLLEVSSGTAISSASCPIN